MKLNFLVLSDSHGSVFKTKLWRSSTPDINWNYSIIFGATLSGLTNPNSKTQAMPKIESSLNDSHYDAIVLQFGEVDLGFVIWYRAKRDGVDVNIYTQKAIENYKKLILKASNISSCFVISCPLPTINDTDLSGSVAEARSEIEVKIEERTRLTTYFNKEISLFCLANNIKYINLDPFSMGKNGLINETLLNQNKFDHHYDKFAYASLLREHLLPQIRSVFPKKVITQNIVRPANLKSSDFVLTRLFKVHPIAVHILLENNFFDQKFINKNLASINEIKEYEKSKARTCRAFALEFEQLSCELANIFLYLASKYNKSLPYLGHIKDRIKLVDSHEITPITSTLSVGSPRVSAFLIAGLLNTDKDPFSHFVSATIKRELDASCTKLYLVIYKTDVRELNSNSEMVISKLSNYLSDDDLSRIEVLVYENMDPNNVVLQLVKKNVSHYFYYTGLIVCLDLPEILIKNYPVILFQTNSKNFPFKNKFDLLFINHLNNKFKLPFSKRVHYLFPPCLKRHVDVSNRLIHKLCKQVIVSALSRDRVGLALEKNQNFLSKMIDFLNVHDVEWHILGQSSTNFLAKVDNQLTNNNKIKIIEYVDDIESYLSQADIFLNVPNSSGGGATSRLAIEGNTPLLSIQDDGDASRWLTDYVKIRTVDDLFDNLLNILNNKNESFKLLKEQQNYIENLSSENNHKLYQDLISNSYALKSIHQSVFAANSSGEVWLNNYLIKWDFTKKNAPLVVSFADASQKSIIQKTNESQSPWGYEFIKKHDVNVLSIACLNCPTWYRDKELHTFLEVNTPCLKRFKTILGYGMSMGAFGVTSFASLFNFSRVLIYYPISTLNENLASFETRYSNGVKSYDWEGDYSDGAGNLNGYIVFDPYNKQDALHAARYTGLTPLKCTFLGHGFAELLITAGLPQKLFNQFVFSKISATDFSIEIKFKRKLAKYYNTMSGVKNSHLTPLRNIIIKKYRRENQPLIKNKDRQGGNLVEPNKLDKDKNKKLILHVGAHKTGTTTIQKSLEMYEENLEKSDYTFIPIFQSIKGMALRVFFNSDCTDKFWLQFLNNIKTTNIIISAEELSLLSVKQFLILKELFHRLNWDYSVHYFLRDPSSWKDSDCKQIVRSGSGLITDEYKYNAIRRYCEIPANLDKVFGVENVVYHKFEDAISVDLMRYFSDKCLKNDQLIIPEIRTNDSISLVSLKFANLLTKVRKKGQGRNMMLGKIINTIEGPKPRKYFGLSKIEAKKVNEGIEYLEKRDGINYFSRVQEVVDIDKSAELTEAELQTGLIAINDYCNNLDENVSILMESAKFFEKEGQLEKSYDLIKLALLIRPNAPFINEKMKYLSKKLGKD